MQKPERWVWNSLNKFQSLKPRFYKPPSGISRLWRTVRWFLRIIIWPVSFALNLVIALSLGALAIYFWVIPTLPEEAAVTRAVLQQPLRVYDSNGRLMEEFGAQRREPISYAQTPPLLVKAFLAAEDSRFFEHTGVDVHGLLRAAVSVIRTGEPSQGGSTITMQLVRNLFLTPEKSMRRKLSELVLATRLETLFPKEKIFEFYQNRIFFGHQAYGIGAAARTYYGKGVNELSLAQMATLAGIPQAPSIHNPVTHPRHAIIRRAYVLRRMLALHWITQAECDAAIDASEEARLVAPTIELNAPYLAEMARRKVQKVYGDNVYTSGMHVITTVDSQLQLLAEKALAKSLIEYDQRHGYRGAEATTDATATTEKLDKVLAKYPPVQGLQPGIVLAVDAQNAKIYLGAGKTEDLTRSEAEWAVPAKSRHNQARLTLILKVGNIIRVMRNNAGNLRLAQIPMVEGALVALSPNDGAIRALVGGFDFKRSQFNRAADIRRQPGSSFKPFVYAAALAQGWTPDSTIDDSPLEVRVGRRVWRPRNIDGKYLGTINLRAALAHSRNLAAVQLLRTLGLEPTRQFAIKFGFRPEQLPNGLSLALGSGYSAPLQMAGAYATFANGGFRINPYLISQIQDPYGQIIYQASPLQACPQCITPAAPDSKQQKSNSTPNSPKDPKFQKILEPAAAEMARDLLQEVIRSGTGKRALSLNNPNLGGKTGTSNDVKDAWFCGFSPDIVVVAWMGFDNSTPLGNDEMGGHSALGMWIDFMQDVLPLLPMPQPTPNAPVGNWLKFTKDISPEAVPIISTSNKGDVNDTEIDLSK